MNFVSCFNPGTHRTLALSLAVLLPINATFLAPSAAVQVTPLMDGQVDMNCRGLHAGIRAEFVKRDPSNNQSTFVMVNFVLLNDGGTPADTSTGTWKLVIDGKELSDSWMIFGNGPQLVNGWRTLNPGETAEFGKDLDVITHFPEVRDYKVSWHGNGFQSPTITVKNQYSGTDSREQPLTLLHVTHFYRASIEKYFKEGWPSPVSVMWDLLDSQMTVRPFHGTWI